MLVYKYRDGDINKFEGQEISNFERDLRSIEKNYFWASNRKQLNDPCEGLVTKKSFENQSGYLGLFIKKESKKSLENVNNVLEDTISFREKLGIYSLSKTFKDELLWAYYGNSHKGFCIEYDLNILSKNYNHYFPVTYGEKPEDLALSDASHSDNIFKKIVGTKSTRWKHEQEIRILTDEYGENSYNYKALKSIYFGLRMNIKVQTEIMNRLKGRGVKYYKIELIANSYKFQAKPIADINDPRITYLKEIPIIITGNYPIPFKIIKQNYWAVKEKGNVEIELEKVISEKELLWLAETIKENLFFNAELVIMLYYIKNKDKGMAWATTHFQNGKINLSINGLLE